MNLQFLPTFKPLKRIGFILFIFCVQYGYSQNIQQWYDEAQERIDTLRRGAFGIEIYDKNGNAYTGPVKVRMEKHEFPFGIAFDFYEGEIQTEVPTETQWMKAAMYKYFNYGVSGNSFKWSGIDPWGNGPDYTNFENALNWTQKVGWELRAHTLLWGGAEGDNHAMPQWVTNLGTAEAVYDKCEERIKRELTKYKGLVKEYDVINEPLHATYTQELYGDSLNWKSFKWAYEADPDAELFVNDYNVEYIWGDADKYKTLIEDMLANGAPVKGIGMQAHFWDCCRPSITNFVTQINKLAEIGLPIKFTEYDYGGNLTEAEQAEDFIKVVTIAFSHPSVNGMISWGLSDKGAWRENSGYFTADHRPKLAADTLEYFTKKLWATNFDFTMNSGQVENFDAYYGDYLVDVQFGDTIKQFSIPLYKANEDSVFKLEEKDAVIKGPELISAQLAQLNQLELAFDKPMAQASLDKYNFRVFTSNDIYIKSIALKDGEDSILVLDLSHDVSFLDYATVSYFPGTLTSKDGGIAKAFGIEHIIIPKALNKEPLVDDQTFSLEENAFLGEVVGTVIAIDPEGSTLTYSIKSGNSSGTFRIDPATGKLTVASPSLIDHDTNPEYNLVVEVSDGVNTSVVNVTVQVTVVLGLVGMENGGVKVYPNPARNHLNISSKEEIESIRIYSISGKLLQQKRYEKSVKEDTLPLKLNNGVYILKITSGNGVQTSKLLVE